MDVGQTILIFGAVVIYIQMRDRKRFGPKQKDRQSRFGVHGAEPTPGLPAPHEIRSTVPRIPDLRAQELELQELRERVAVLERIVTDERTSHDLARQIEELRK